MCSLVHKLHVAFAFSKFESRHYGSELSEWPSGLTIDFCAVFFEFPFKITASKLDRCLIPKRSLDYECNATEIVFMQHITYVYFYIVYSIYICPIRIA